MIVVSLKVWSSGGVSLGGPEVRRTESSTSDEVADIASTSSFARHLSTNTPIVPRSLKCLRSTLAGSWSSGTKDFLSISVIAKNQCWKRVTNIMLIKTPFSADISSISKRFLPLTHSEINFCHVLRNSWFRTLQVDTVTIALIVTIHEYQHCQTLCYVFFGCQTYGKRLRVGWNSNVGLDHAITIGSTVLREGNLCVAPLDLTSELL